MVVSVLLVNWHAGVGVGFRPVAGFWRCRVLAASVGVAFDDEFVGGGDEPIDGGLREAGGLGGIQRLEGEIIQNQQWKSRCTLTRVKIGTSYGSGTASSAAASRPSITAARVREKVNRRD